MLTLANFYSYFVFIISKYALNLGFIFDVNNIFIFNNFKWRAVEIHTFTNTGVRLTAS